MRIPSWFLVSWVILTTVVAIGGGIVTYNQSRDRTQELNEIAPLEEGIDAWRTVELLVGWDEPELRVDTDIATPVILQPQQLPTDPRAEPTPDVTSNPSGVGGQATTAPTSEATTPTPTDGSSDIENTPTAPVVAPRSDPRRVNILLMGIDQREGEAGPFRTDTMIVLSLHPAANSGVMLSIPRDIWVAYPSGLGEGKINNANVIGTNNQYPGGGPELAKRTVQSFLGIPIHYYILVNFDAFLTIVDAIGPIEVCPPQPIDDPDYPDGSYGYKHVTFPAGCQDLEGERLLEYSRTRATEGGDLDRAERQQEVIVSIRNKAVSLGGVSSLADEAAAIWESVYQNIRTDLSFQELIELAFTAQQIPLDNIRQETIGYDRVYIRTLPDADSTEILVPIPSDIAALVAELFQ